MWTQEYQFVCFSASGGDQEQAAGSLHLPEDEGRQEDPEGQGYQASLNHFPSSRVADPDPHWFQCGSGWVRIRHVRMFKIRVQSHSKNNKQIKGLYIVYFAGFRIRIHFLRIRIRIQMIRMEANTDPDPGL